MADLYQTVRRDVKVYKLLSAYNTFTRLVPYLLEAFTSKQIADKLFISEHTVINHKRNMHDKSDTQNSAALIYFAFINHLL